MNSGTFGIGVGEIDHNRPSVPAKMSAIHAAPARIFVPVIGKYVNGEVCCDACVFPPIKFNSSGEYSPRAA